MWCSRLWCVAIAAFIGWVGAAACDGDGADPAAGGAGGSGATSSGGSAGHAGGGGSDGGSGGGPPVSPGCSAYEGTHEIFYVNVDGNDDHSGRFPTHQGGSDGPWRTIGKANATLQAGQAVCVGAGQYDEILEPHNSGTEGATIVYTILGDGEVLLTGEPGKANVVVLGRGYAGLNGPDSYVVVDGFHIRHNDPENLEYDPWQGDVPKPTLVSVYGDDSHHNEIRYLQIRCQGTPVWEGASERAISLSKSDHNLIENNYIDGLCSLGILTGGTSTYNVIRGNYVLNCYHNNVNISSSLGELQHNLIEDNVLCGSLISDGIQFENRYDLPDGEIDYDSNRGVVIRNNIICDSGENAVDLKGGAFVVIEGNIMYGVIGNNNGGLEPGVGDVRYPGAHSIMHGSNANSRDVIIRGNVIYDGNGGILPESGYKIYNNVVVANNRDYTGPNSDWVTASKPAFTGISAWNGLDNVDIKNNILGGHFSADIAVGTSPVDLDIDHNLYFNEGDAKLVAYTAKGDWTLLDFAAWQAFLAATPGVTGADAHAIEADPRFVDVPPNPVGTPDQFDFHVQPDSPCIDAGAFLTTTRTAGSGTSIEVHDAAYFSDGYGIAEGDLIQLDGQAQTARITSVDRDADIIAVDTALTWSAGLGVALPYQGSAPDIGAFE